MVDTVVYIDWFVFILLPFGRVLFKSGHLKRDIFSPSLYIENILKLKVGVGGGVMYNVLVLQHTATLL